MIEKDQLDVLLDNRIMENIKDMLQDVMLGREILVRTDAFAKEELDKEIADFTRECMVKFESMSMFEIFMHMNEMVANRVANKTGE